MARYELHFVSDNRNLNLQMTVDMYDSRRNRRRYLEAIYCETAIVGSQVTSFNLLHRESRCSYIQEKGHNSN